MPIADFKDYFHAEEVERRRERRERDEEWLKRTRPAARESLRACLEQRFGLPEDTPFSERVVTKGVKLDARGREVREAGAVIIVAAWEQEGAERYGMVVQDADSQPVPGVGAEYYGKWADRMRWLGGAFYYREDNELGQLIPEVPEAKTYDWPLPDSSAEQLGRTA